MAISLQKVKLIDDPRLLEMFISYEDKTALKEAKRMLESSPLIGLAIKDNKGNIAHGVYFPSDKKFITTARPLYKEDIDLNAVYDISKTMVKVFKDFKKTLTNNQDVKNANLDELTSNILNTIENNKIVVENEDINIIANKEIISVGSLFDDTLENENSTKVSLDMLANFCNKAKEVIHNALSVEEYIQEESRVEAEQTFGSDVEQQVGRVL